MGGGKDLFTAPTGIDSAPTSSSLRRGAGNMDDSKDTIGSLQRHIVCVSSCGGRACQRRPKVGT